MGMLVLGLRKVKAVGWNISREPPATNGEQDQRSGHNVELRSTPGFQLNPACQFSQMPWVVDKPPSLVGLQMVVSWQKLWPTNSYLDRLIFNPLVVRYGAGWPIIHAQPGFSVTRDAERGCGEPLNTWKGSRGDPGMA